SRCKTPTAPSARPPRRSTLRCDDRATDRSPRHLHNLQNLQNLSQPPQPPPTSAAGRWGGVGLAPLLRCNLVGVTLITTPRPSSEEQWSSVVRSARTWCVPASWRAGSRS